MSFEDEGALVTGQVVQFLTEFSNGTNNNFGGGSFLSKQVAIPANDYSFLRVTQYFTVRWDGNNVNKAQIDCDIDIDADAGTQYQDFVRAIGVSGAGNTDFRQNGKTVMIISKPAGGTLNVTLDPSLNDAACNGQATATIVEGIV